MNYPRMLYRGGDVHASYIIVFDEEGEKAARKDGFAIAHEKADDKPKGARKAKQ